MSDTDTIYITEYNAGTGSSDATIRYYYVNDSDTTQNDTTVTGYISTSDDSGVIYIPSGNARSITDITDGEATVYNAIPSGTVNIRVKESAMNYDGYARTISFGESAPLTVTGSIGVVDGSNYYYFTTFSDVCFEGNTLISVSPNREKRINQLKDGDYILTCDGNMKKINRIVTINISGDRLELVHFKKGSLGGGIPTRDTYITKQHTVRFMGRTFAAKVFAENAHFPNVNIARRSDKKIYQIQIESGEEWIYANGMMCTSLEPLEPGFELPEKKNKNHD
jgi:hypothetical protein